MKNVEIVLVERDNSKFLVYSVLIYLQIDVKVQSFNIKLVVGLV